MTVAIRRLVLAFALAFGLAATGVMAAGLDLPIVLSAAHADDGDDDGGHDDDGGRDDDGGGDRQVPKGGVETGIGGAQTGDDDDDDDDGRGDDGQAPRGGVETGAGGTAGDGDPLLPLTMAGGVGLLAAGGALLLRRRLVGGA